jgi:co-chaperonin GroES (HSP10)
MLKSRKKLLIQALKSMSAVKLESGIHVNVEDYSGYTESENKTNLSISSKEELLTIIYSYINL